MPKLLCISDTHLRQPALEPADILIHSGDALLRGNKAEFHAFLRWWSPLKQFKHKVFIAGNHDKCLENSKECEDLLKADGTHYLFNSGVELEGLKFWGSPYQPEFYDWAFNLPRNGAKLKETWAKIPDDTEVLITHGPPFGTLDRTPENYYGHGGNNIGCELLRERVDELKQLQLHCFGHCHNGYGQLLQPSMTRDKPGKLFVNASICNEEYRPVNKPITVEL